MCLQDKTKEQLRQGWIWFLSVSATFCNRSNREACSRVTKDPEIGCAARQCLWQEMLFLCIALRRHHPSDPTKKDDKPVRAFGWRSDGAKPLWRIEQNTPFPLPCSPFRRRQVSTQVGMSGARLCCVGDGFWPSLKHVFAPIHGVPTSASRCRIDVSVPIRLSPTPAICRVCRQSAGKGVRVEIDVLQRDDLPFPASLLEFQRLFLTTRFAPYI